MVRHQPLISKGILCISPHNNGYGWLHIAIDPCVTLHEGLFGRRNHALAWRQPALIQPCPQVVRTHFHDFMLDVHKRLRKTAGESDPLARVADALSRDTKVLALDEFFVTDVADATILHRLFDRLWDSGLVLVATSNRAPDKLYEGGLQRKLFLPFIQRLKVGLTLAEICSNVTDGVCHIMWSLCLPPICMPHDSYILKVRYHYHIMTHQCE